MKEQTQNEKKIQPSRVIFSALFFAVPIVLISLFPDAIFYLSEKSDTYNSYRFLWCVCCSMWGFSVIAFHWRHVTVSIFPDYLLYYPFLLLTISALVFSSMHLFDKTSGYLFYYFSFALCFILSFLVDEFFDFFRLIVKKASAKMG